MKQSNSLQYRLATNTSLPKSVDARATSRAAEWSGLLNKPSLLSLLQTTPLFRINSLSLRTTYRRVTASLQTSLCTPSPLSSRLAPLQHTMAPFEASAAAQIDEILKKYTQDPYTQVPRVVVAAASSKEVLYTGMAGYEHLPPHPATPEQLAEATKIKDDSEPESPDHHVLLFDLHSIIA